MNDMQRWISRYEQMRTDPYTSIKGRLSSRFQLEGLSWDEIREIPIPELNCTFGGACSALRKSWYAYKRTKKDGLPAPDLAFRILKIQKFLGFPLSVFHELDRYGGGSNNEWVEEELSREEQRELRKEEEAEELAGWGLDDDEKSDDDPW